MSLVVSRRLIYCSALIFIKALVFMMSQSYAIYKGYILLYDQLPLDIGELLFEQDDE
jgi:hypothetical protein